MSHILAIDPGTEESGYAWIEPGTCKPFDFGKVENHALLRKLRLIGEGDRVAIEMVASYGMPVGAEVFDTCVWIGRYVQEIRTREGDVMLVKRQPVKLHHCHSPKANDATVRRALVDRFAYGQTNHGKGTKASPGWFYGFKADVWAAYALAVYAADTEATEATVTSW